MKFLFIIIFINSFYINIIISNKLEICINNNVNNNKNYNDNNNCILFLNKSLGYNYLLDNKSKQHQCINNNFTLTYTLNRNITSSDKSISVAYTIAVGSYRGNII